MKWMPSQPDVALSHEQISRLHVLLCVLNPNDVEVMQSAEILYREFGHRGLKVLLDAREQPAASKLAHANELALPLTISIGGEPLQRGEVELWSRSHAKRSVKLEDVVDIGTDLLSGAQMNLMKNPIMLGLDVDSREQALSLVKTLAPHIGAVKLGPRLVVRFGAEFVTEMARQLPVFVDNKYLDIPSTMEGAIRATFAAGATFATVHAWAGPEALARLAKVETELNRERPFKILVVTILTSFAPETLPAGLAPQPIREHVLQLAKMALNSGLSGLVCSPHEVAELRALNSQVYLVTPGVRMATDAVGDQKRVETPAQAMRLGASALVIGRPIYEAAQPLAAVEQILASLRA